ncbi:MAG: hypothetical protein Alpg2KO_25030 [Alphaproteobacteria bacterium]
MPPTLKSEVFWDEVRQRLAAARTTISVGLVFVILLINFSGKISLFFTAVWEIIQNDPSP